MTIYNQDTPEIQLKRKDGTVAKVQITNSNDTYQFFKALFNEGTLEIREEAIAVFLDRANKTVGWFKIGVGGMAGVIIDPKLLFKAALDCYASSVIVAHNHPSGNLKPSEQDKRLTERIIQAGRILDVPVLDHMIISAEGYYSFADEGAI